MQRRQLLVVACLAAVSSLSVPGTADARGGGHYSGRIYSASSGLHSRGIANSGSHYVHGYIRRDGRYVSGYRATNSNGTKNDNYSTRGNVNPWTGKAGTKPTD